MKRIYCLISLAGLLGLTGCQNTLIDRSLIFATHTSLGLEVSVSPQEMDSPAKLLIGYKRTEGVLNPVYYNLEGNTNRPSNHTVNDFYRADCYSVLAKFEGAVSGGGGGSASTTMPAAPAATTGTTGNGATADATATKDTAAKTAAGSNGSVSATVNGAMTLSQWFATGRAAEILAANGGAAALTDNPGVAAAASAAGSKNLGDRLAALPADARSELFSSVYGTISKLAATNRDAAKQRDALNSAAAQLLTIDIVNLPANYIFNKKPDPTHNNLPVLTIDAPGIIQASDPSLFEDVVGRLSVLESSIMSLEDAKAAGVVKAPPTVFVDAINGAAPGDYFGPGKQDADHLDSTIAAYKKMRDNLRTKLSTLKDLQNAVHFIAVQLGLKE